MFPARVQLIMISKALCPRSVFSIPLIAIRTASSALGANGSEHVLITPWSQWAETKRGMQYNPSMAEEKFDPSKLAEYARLHWDDRVTENDPTVVKLRDGIINGQRSALASAITLVESRHPTKRAQGNFLLHAVLEHERKRFLEKGTDSLIFRIGISGSPGVGKSSFIEALGSELTNNQGKKIAVLTVDPSSATTGGRQCFEITCHSYC
ncbi:hypothetical protein AB6A40_000823 [Gnathostoma spinigerum]|uniref:Uncharacterized protein n=1 Tax=Gnathostoma spinigerum TaxID=75299 RepID=A0ABD6E2T8_9BILA